MIVESETQHDQKLHARLQEMMCQITVQKAPLEASRSKEHSGNIYRCRVKSPRREFRGSGGHSAQECDHTPIQGTIDGPCCDEAEEIEEVLFQDTVKVVPVSRGSNQGSMPEPAPPNRQHFASNINRLNV